MANMSTRKPVRSAEAVAVMRAASHRERDPTVRNPDHLARHFVGRLYGLLLMLPCAISRRVIERISPGSYCYFLARTKFIDGHLLQAIEHGIRQVVILGAGYDSRASRFGQKLREGEVRVLEVDLPSTQADKRARMRACSIAEPRNVTYVAHDFNEGELIDVLRRHGFDPQRPTFFIWEGVTYYLQSQAVANVLDLVVGRCAKGSSLAFDYSLRAFVAGDESTYGGRAMQKWLKQNNERFLFGLNADEIRGYVRAFNLSVTEDIGSAEIKARYLTDQRSRSLGEPLGHLRLVHATLN